jgi:Ca2+-binding RTX toxin-like protein
MTTFTGTDGNDTANAATGEIVGFTGGTQAELQDGIGDTITGSGGDDFIFAANANDRIEGGDGFDLLNGGEGNDSIYANTQSDVDGSIIGDELTGNVGHDSLYGSSGADTLIGSDGGDYLNGGAGADVLEGGNDDDFFDLSSGDIGAGETLDGGAGSGDTIQVGGNLNFTAANIAGMEWLFFATGAGATFSAQQIKNGFGSSLLLYSSTQIGSTSETLRIEMGAETSLSLTLNAIFDTLGGGWSSEDRVNIIGDSNGENISCSVSLSNSGFIPIRMFGNGGNDTLTGGNGPDLLAGGVGNDVLNGGVGSDTLIGGVGIDTMSWAGFAVAITFTLPDGGEGLTPVFGGLGEDLLCQYREPHRRVARRSPHGQQHGEYTERSRGQ